MKKMPLRRLIRTALLLLLCVSCAARQDADVSEAPVYPVDEQSPDQTGMRPGDQWTGKETAGYAAPEDRGAASSPSGSGAVIRQENTAFKVYQYNPGASRTPGTETLLSDISKEVAGKVFYELQAEGEKQLSGRIAVVSAVPLSDLKRESEFGRVMAEFLLTDLADRGLQVTELRLGNEINILPQTGEFILSQNVGELANNSPDIDYVVVSTFSNTKKTLIVQGRLVSLENGMILASWRYGLPLNQELLGLFNNAEQPFKVPVRGAQQNTDPF